MTTCVHRISVKEHRQSTRLQAHRSPDPPHPAITLVTPCIVLTYAVQDMSTKAAAHVMTLRYACMYFRLYRSERGRGKHKTLKLVRLCPNNNKLRTPSKPHNNCYFFRCRTEGSISHGPLVCGALRGRGRLRRLFASILSERDRFVRFNDRGVS